MPWERSSGRKLMTAGAIVTLIGFGIVGIRWLTAGRD